MTKRLLILLVLLASPLVALATTDTITATGSWVAPTGVTSVTVDAWAGGGGGRNGGSVTGGQGGGGGAFSEKLNIPVTAGNSYTVTVGTGGTGGVFFGASDTAGGDSWFSTTGTVLAKGGAAGTSGGAGGALASGVGDTKFSGGNGGGDGSTSGCGGGGGGGAGTTGNGGDGTSSSGTCTSGVGGTGTSIGGGNGGTPDIGAGATKGGGGSGSSAGNTGGAGARGEVQITYTAVTVSTVHTKVTFAKGTGYITKSTVYIK